MDMREEIQNTNALEEWAYCDTVALHSQLNTPPFANYQKAGWFSSFAAMAAAQEIPFFKTRNEAMVGAQFCNMDIADRFSVPFHVFALGIQFIAPTWSSDGDPNLQHTPSLFSVELAKHCAFEFKVGQDQKLLSPAVMLCGGAGIVGNNRPVGSNQSSGTNQAQSYVNGRAHRKNHLRFTDPIEIPRNQSIEGRLKISRYGQTLLADMPAPGSNSASLSAGQWYHTYLIRVSLYGVREVQLRNAQSF